MNKLDLNEIRTAFLDFYEERKHTRLKSFSLVPKDDASLFLINAGMAPLKAYFLGEKKMENNRAVSSQRCVRTQDIESVGKTDRHATYFEMLGDFSFGDYFKNEAIHWAFEFLTKVIGLEKDHLWITVYKDDEEAFRIWTEEMGIAPDHMFKLGKEDNFWELDQGPCGPCSEIHYDRGEKYGEGTSPLDNSDRFMEIWNLVFTQFDKKSDGTYEPLANPNIDTGMGLERIAVVVEDVANIFEVSTFRPLRDKIETLSGKKYGQSAKIDESIRIIMDHSKAMTFLVLDGIVPSNEGRGYILRRLLRRAYRHGKLLGIEGEFLTSIIDYVIEVYKNEYPELLEAKERIYKVIVREENQFQQTIDQGLELLNKVITDLKENNRNEISGEEAFKLYDTYGFPLDLTMEIASEQGISIDEEAFNACMKKQREKSRENRKGGVGWDETVKLDLSDVDATIFTGYDHFTDEVKVASIFVNNEKVNEIKEGEEGIIILNKTPFYGEGGGQIGDTGTIETESVKFVVNETTKDADGIYFHTGNLERGNIKVGDELIAKLDADRRNDIRRNHSATHLLQKALKIVLGDHVQQAGSYVDDERLRFDFSHYDAMTKEEVKKVEEIVNRAIFDSYPVVTDVKSIKEAIESGAVGLFEDKYKDMVRVVSMGDFSKELCGGTHVDNTAQLMMFRILSEQGVSSGVRRIEAVSGRACYQEILDLNREIDNISEAVKAKRDQIEGKILSMQEEQRELKKKLESYEAKAADSLSHELENDIIVSDGISLLTKEIPNKSMDQLKEIADHLKEGKENFVLVLASVLDGKVYFVSSVDDALVKKGINAGKIVKTAAQIAGGNGGGRPNFATAGGKDANKIPEALSTVSALILENK